MPQLQREAGTSLSEINMVPFIDVVLVLLIIFMITTPMLLQPGIKIRLPEAAHGESQTEKNITVFIDRNGGIFIDNLRMNIESFR